jgi:hypothetical protein
LVVEANQPSLRLTHGDRPGDVFEMIAYRYANGQVMVNVFKVGKLTRHNVALRDASKDPPCWAASGDVIEFAGEVWTPTNHAAAVAWIDDLDSTRPPATTDAGAMAAPSTGADATSSARSQLRSAAALVKVAGVIVAGLSMVGGLFLLLYEDDFDEQPFVGAGISSIIAGVVFWTFAYFAATFAEAWLETTEGT